MSVITGDAVSSIKNMEDKQVLQQCMIVLRELFKEQVGLFSQTWVDLKNVIENKWPFLF